MAPLVVGLAELWLMVLLDGEGVALEPRRTKTGVLAVIWVS